MSLSRGKLPRHSFWMGSRGFTCGSSLTVTSLLIALLLKACLMNWVFTFVRGKTAGSLSSSFLAVPTPTWPNRIRNSNVIWKRHSVSRQSQYPVQKVICRTSGVLRGPKSFTMSWSISDQQSTSESSGPANAERSCKIAITLIDAAAGVCVHGKRAFLPSVSLAFDYAIASGASVVDWFRKRISRLMF